MTRDEARKLLGGYATGSLTEPERDLLFQAALEDQDLFEELAGEQALKELIEQPGVRQRLHAALDVPKKQRVWWPWAAAFAAALLVTIVARNQRQSEAPVEIAQTFDKATPAPTPVEPTSSPAAVPSPTPKVAAPAKSPTAPPAAREVGPVVAEQNVASAEKTKEVAMADAAPQAVGVLGGVPNPKAPAVAAFRSNVLGAPGAPIRWEFPAPGKLRLTALLNAGTMEIRAGQQVLLERRRVDPQTPVELEIPSEVNQVQIEFTVGNQPPAITTVPIQR